MQSGRDGRVWATGEAALCMSTLSECNPHADYLLEAKGYRYAECQSRPCMGYCLFSVLLRILQRNAALSRYRQVKGRSQLYVTAVGHSCRSQL